MNDSKQITSIDKTYSEVKAAVDANQKVSVRCSYSGKTYFINLTTWQTGLISFFDFTNIIRIGSAYSAFTVRLGTQSSMNFCYIDDIQKTSEKITTWSETPSTTYYPTESLVWNTFQRKPDVIYNDPVGFAAVDEDAGKSWYLTGLDLSKYKYIKCYVCSGGDSNSNYSPQHIVEVSLDDRCIGTLGYFVGSHTGHCPNNRNRLHIATFCVDAAKTSLQFIHSISIYGTAASDSISGRNCFLIEGYYE